MSKTVKIALIVGVVLLAMSIIYVDAKYPGDASGKTRHYDSLLHHVLLRLGIK